MASLNFKNDFSLTVVGFFFFFFWMAINEELSFEAGQTKSGCMHEMCPGNRVATDTVKRAPLPSAVLGAQSYSTTQLCGHVKRKKEKS